MQLEKKLKEYVCGFYFDHTFQYVALIWKNKPDWQKGKLNGIGGKIESGELPIAAMRREFREETGILHNEWMDLVTLSTDEWRVHFFCSIGKVNEFEYVETKEEEEVAKIEVSRLLAWDFDHIPNLDWLIPMAINKLQFPDEKMSFSESPSKEGNNPIISVALETEAKEHAKLVTNNPENRLYVAQGYYNGVLKERAKEGNKEREVLFGDWLRTQRPDVFHGCPTTAELWNEWNNQYRMEGEKEGKP